jgi:TonB family protein
MITHHTTRALALAGAVLLRVTSARADEVVAADHTERAPVVISQERPVYPYSLRLTGNKGEVLVDFVVDPQGNVVRADVSRSSHPDFEAPAVEAVLNWKFKPGFKDGHPVFVHMAVPIIFQLVDRQSLHDPRGSVGGVDPWQIPDHAPKQAPPELQYDEAPRPLLTSAPVYPFDLLIRHVKGRASVTFAIDKQGHPHVVKVMSATLADFGAATTAMIEAWRFEPAKKDGKPCWSVLRKDQVFEMDASDFPMNDSAERLLRDLRKSPCPILSDFRNLDTPIRGRFTPSPVVPEGVLASNAAETAVIEFVVDHAGHAQLPRIISATNPDFGWAAATAVARWQYTTPYKSGKPVDVRVRVPLEISPRNPAAKGS